MANQESNYSSEFKIKVAREALARDSQNLEPLSEKYDVPVSVILTWAAQLERSSSDINRTTAEPADTTSTEEENSVVNVEIDDQEVSESVSHGVMGDKLDYKKLTFWSVLGIIFVVIFVQLLVEMYQMTIQYNQERVSAQSEYHEVSDKKQRDLEKLSSYGVVDIENGIYRMPIDSVINNMAVDGE